MKITLAGGRVVEIPFGQAMHGIRAMKIEIDHEEFHKFSTPQRRGDYINYVLSRCFIAPKENIICYCGQKMTEIEKCKAPDCPHKKNF